ncbi:hypothetical protein PV325_009163, partial [Microctonus aethiopoides]
MGKKGKKKRASGERGKSGSGQVQAPVVQTQRQNQPSQQQRGPTQGQQQQQQHQQQQQRRDPTTDNINLTTPMQQLNIGAEVAPGGVGGVWGRGGGRGGGAWGRGDGRGGAWGRGDGGGAWARGDGGGGGGGGAWAQGGSQRQERDGDFGSVPSSSMSSTPSNTTGPVKSSKSGQKDPTEKKTVPEYEESRLKSLIPRRKNPMQAGTQGRRISVLTNMIKIVFESNFNIKAMQYDVKFDPDKPKDIKKPAFAALREAHFPKCWPAFDGQANIYSAGNLPFGKSLNTEVTFFDEECQKDRTVKVTMEKVNEIDMSWLSSVKPGIDESIRDQTTMHVLNVILRMAPYNRAIMVGRSFFQQPRLPAFDLSDGMELWVGMFQSAVLGWNPYFNVDVAYKAFLKSEDVIEVMKDLCADRNGRPRELDENMLHCNKQKIEKHFCGLKVIFQLPNQPSSKRTFRVNGLDRPADKATFKLDNGDTTTVERYFLDSKKYKLRYPKLPCLWVGSRSRQILLPPELCKVKPGVVTNRELGVEQTRRMIKEAAHQDPATRKGQILEAFNGMKYNQDPTLKEFGITLGGDFETVNARVLTPPTLQYATRTVNVSKGVWRSSDFFNRPSSIPANKWTILNIGNRMADNILERFIKSLQRIGNANGMNINSPKRPFVTLRLQADRDAQELIDYFADQKTQGMKLILVVIPKLISDAYPKIKQQAELQVGVLTQCVKDTTIKKICDRDDDGTVRSIILKINCKLNGINHTIASSTKLDCLNGAIIFGADVTHPSSNAADIPSIAAVTASHGSDVFKYNVMIRLQPPQQEIILNLEEIVIEQLKIYHKNNKSKPNKILFYRDGVSEGEFPTVMHYELQAIRNACRKFGGATKYEPKITFLVAQKRHHIRLFPTDARNSDGRNGNVQAGTIVDTTITHPSHIDFYLASHASMQGTARPTKYRCLWDDNNMSEDDIEKLTFYLCHMCSRCDRSISYPAPTYYAHLAAFRARTLIHGVSIQMNNLEQAQLRFLTLNPDL